MKIDIEGGEYEVLFNTPVNIFKKFLESKWNIMN